MPSGPMGLPRPIATGSVNLIFELPSHAKPTSPLVMETAIRNEMKERGMNQFSSVQVTVNAGGPPDSQVVTVITSEDEMPVPVMNAMWSEVEDQLQVNIPERRVKISVT